MFEKTLVSLSLKVALTSFPATLVQGMRLVFQASSSFFWSSLSSTVSVVVVVVVAVGVVVVPAAAC